MSDQTIIAVYDTPAHAGMAVQDMIQASVPEAAIQRHSPEGVYHGATLDPVAHDRQGAGYWSSVFGGDPDRDPHVYDRSVREGGQVVCVRVPDRHVTAVMAILERHAPVDMDKRAEGYGLDAQATVLARSPGPGVADQIGASASRLVNIGTPRVRRFSVEPGAGAGHPIEVTEIAQGAEASGVSRIAEPHGDGGRVPPAGTAG